MKRSQSLALMVAIACGTLGLLTATGCPVLPPGDPGAAGWLHPLVIVAGAVSGFVFSLRSRAIDAERWRVVDDATITSGEREYAHREAEREKKSAGVVFLMAPLTLGFWLGSHFRGERVSAADLLSLTPLVGFLLGMGAAKLALRGKPAPVRRDDGSAAMTGDDERDDPGGPDDGGERGCREDDDVAAEDGEDADAPDVVELPITNTLDLHTFLPREVADVVRDYLDAAWEKGLRELRIVHGRGIGVQREIVRKVLERDPRVRSFRDAPPEAGGWGATLVSLSD